MKTVLSILFLIVTSMYLMPVKEFFKAGTAVCVADVDEQKEENGNKEKVKDLFTFSFSELSFEKSYGSRHQHMCFAIPLPLHTVETPPPDQV